MNLAILTPESIISSKFPVTELLENSIYYPSSHFDGPLVKAYAHDFSSFVYCDYGVTEDEFKTQIETFRGYDLLALRTVEKEELYPNGWKTQIPDHLLKNYDKYVDYVKQPFVYWAVYQRKSGYSDMHGPSRFSLLFNGGEGVLTYQALYWSNHTKAKAVAIIRPGTGFGHNWTNFLDGNKALGYVVTQNPYGRPEYIITDSSKLLKWNSYPQGFDDRNGRASRDINRYFCKYLADGE